jgi:hypothetical protein
MQSTGNNLIITLCCATLLSFSIHLNAQVNYRKASVCEIKSQPKKWNLQSVTIDADLAVVIPHGMFLIDKHCPSRKGLQIDYPSTDVDQSLENLHHLILSNGFMLNATGTFRGVLKRDPSTKCLYLLLQSILNLQSKSPPTVVPDAIEKPFGDTDFHD